MNTSEIDLDRLVRRIDPKPDERSIAIDNLEHYYGEGETRSHILKDIDLNVTGGEIVMIKGPSGCGKTTLLTLVGTLRTICEGSIKTLGTELNGLSNQGIIEMRKKMGFIFQAHNLFESLTAYQNVNMACELTGAHRDSATKKRIEELLTQLGLGERIHYKPKSLSGGQKQRVAVARGLIHNPPIVLADEPTAALDATSTRIVTGLFRQMADEFNTTILVVTHDDKVSEVADRILTFDIGFIKRNTLIEKAELIGEILMTVEKKSESGAGLFNTQDTSEITEVADQMELRQYQPGDDIIRQGEPGEHFFILAGGTVEILVDGNRVNTIEEGSFFGEVALMEDVMRTATVRALTPTVCFALHKTDFTRIVKRSKSFSEGIRKAISSRS